MAGELFQPAPEAARRLCAEIARRLGPELAAVVFYGSCLRRRSAEGVLDFYAIVDSYRGVYASRRLAWANALLPPNVFYIELPPAATLAEPLRAKYAVISLEDLARAASPRALRSSIWARFCQPVLAVQVRDAGARAALRSAGAQSVRTAVERLLPVLGAAAVPGEPLHLVPAEFWRLAFRETYRNEMRPESPEAVSGLYGAAPERYDRALRLALEALQESGWLRLEGRGEASRVWLPPRVLRRGSRSWRLRRPLAKLAYAASLLKTATTFGDWLPYALWKLERHTGTRLVPGPRQRRHPLIFGWPLLLRALWRRDLR